MDLSKWLTVDLALVAGGAYLAVHYLVSIMRARQAALLDTMRKQIATVAEELKAQQQAGQR